MVLQQTRIITDHIPKIRPFSLVYIIILVIGCYTITYVKPTSPTQSALRRQAQVLSRGGDVLLAATDETIVPVVPTLPPRIAMEIPATKLQTPCFANKTAEQAKELFDIPDFATCTEEYSCLIQQMVPEGWKIAENTRCSITDRWLSGYMEQQSQQRNDAADADDIDADDDVFVAMYFGCNKGYDAIHTAAVLSGRTDVFNKTSWREALEIEGFGVCGQGKDESSSIAAPAAITTTATTSQRRPVNVHCIEAMPDTADRLQKAAINTTAVQHGFQVQNYVVSATPGGTPILFPNGSPGYEAFGMNVCNEEQYRPMCKEVPSVTIDEYVARHVDSVNTVTTGDRTHSKRIPFVSIDIEGYDFTAMHGATRTLYRTDYLEFEYHGCGDWGKQSLKLAIDFLDSIGFVCYWSGMNQLWRITGCWMDYFDFHTWSNVACVNPEHQPELAAKMEQVFRETMLE